LNEAGRRASLRTASASSGGSEGGGGVGGGIGVTGVCSAATSGTSGISTRMRSSSNRGGEREVNTPSPLNFHQNQASTS